MPEVRLIDANAAADKIMRGIETHVDEIGIGATAILIAFARALRDETNFPTIEAEPVRHGRWVPTESDSYADGAPVWDKWECSECGREHSGEEDTLTEFCPRCGAKMDGGADNA